MHYVGVDIAKRTHCAAVLDNAGAMVAEPFLFNNDSQGFASFLMRLGGLGVFCDDCTIAMESTGHYWFALLDFLIAHGFEPIVLNPIQTDAYRKVEQRSRRKNQRDRCSTHRRPRQSEAFCSLEQRR